MKLSNKKVSIIIILITIALSGSVILQAILLKTALKAEEETFRSNIILALNNVVKDLTSFEARNAILQISFDDSTMNSKRRIIKTSIFNDTIDDSLFMFHSISNTLEIEYDSTSTDFGYFFNGNSDKGSTCIQDSILNKSDVPKILTDNFTAHTLHNQIKIFKDSHTISSGNFGIKDSSRILIVEAALGQLEQMELVPIEERIDTLMLDSAIQESFKRINIDLDYSFAVTNRKLDSLILSGSEPILEKISKSPYRTILFPNDLISPTNYLVVYFPNKEFYIYSKLWSLIFPTILFILIIVSCFIYSINLILSQRKTSIRLTDFINNMTHEFKTPIATIQLASEALSKIEVLSDREKTNKFNSMILSENKRMKNQVDKILQIATLEEGDYILRDENLDVHQLLNDVVDSFSILLKQSNGNIKMNLNAGMSEISGDKIHIMNIISNLLDNALKYSKDNPQILITTSNNKSNIEISIKDNGIGIHPDDLNLVFKKYYRVANGDIHNTKGFGLGLSYVKLMVDAHGGTVHLLSALDKGTEVIISLPLK